MKMNNGHNANNTNQCEQFKRSTKKGQKKLHWRKQSMISIVINDITYFTLFT